jgi:Cdc6-like AAA superfamily ATPase
MGEPPHDPDLERRTELRARANRVFTPALPVSQDAVFAGRAGELQQVIDAINRPGQHVLIYGEPGVGKTSLANILAGRLATRTRAVVAPRVNCERVDDFSGIWRKVLGEIRVKHERLRIGFLSEAAVETRRVADSTPDELTTSDVVGILRGLGSSSLLVVIVDEFDRIGDPDVRTAFADTIKLLSDHDVPVTLVIVGVADTVDDLIEQHQSIERALVQVRMPRMSALELQQIVLRGLHLLDLTIEPAALVQIAALSQGLPHYTHLLALHTTTAAIDEGADRLTTVHLGRAIRQSVDQIQQSVAAAYERATRVRGGGSALADALLGCALASSDENGTFVGRDVRAALDRALDEDVAPAAVSRTLASLCKPERGPVLQRLGTRAVARFRFVNPLMPPYVVLKAVLRERISADALVLG